MLPFFILYFLEQRWRRNIQTLYANSPSELSKLFQFFCRQFAFYHEVVTALKNNSLKTWDYILLEQINLDNSSCAHARTVNIIFPSYDVISVDSNLYSDHEWIKLSITWTSTQLRPINYKLFFYTFSWLPRNGSIWMAIC